MIILDTNVLSEIMKPVPSPRVSTWLSSQPATELFTTSITEAEIFLGIELLPRGKRRDSLLSDAEAMFTKDLDGRILGFDSDSGRLFARIVAHRRALGRPINHPDAQIAAIVKLRNAKLATRDVADFTDCGIDLIDPWTI
jgi:predicted nucleic acid-binding protein